MVYKSPSVYLQGAGVLSLLGERSAVLGKSAFVIISHDIDKQITERVNETLSRYGSEAEIRQFAGKADIREIINLTYGADNYEVIIGIGGGRITDVAKAVSYYSHKPLIICPTVASNDAPCSATAVISDGDKSKYISMNNAPDVVIADSEILADAPLKMTVAGIADALSTYYEARLYAKKKNISSVALAMAKLCRDNVFKYAVEACRDISDKKLTEAVERIFETNILASGIGFENTGLACAHAVAYALTECGCLSLHGEKVAYGLLLQLLLEGDTEEFARVKALFKSVGLPCNLDEVGVEPSDYAFGVIADEILKQPFMDNMPAEYASEDIVSAMRKMEF